MKEKIKKILRITLRIISYVFGGFLMLVAVSRLDIVWFLFFGIPGILLISLPELTNKWMKKRHKEKAIESRTRERISELGLNLDKDYTEYYRIRKEEEEKLKDY